LFIAFEGCFSDYFISEKTGTEKPQTVQDARETLPKRPGTQRNTFRDLVSRA
jgi:hypothetical protein